MWTTEQAACHPKPRRPRGISQLQEGYTNVEAIILISGVKSLFQIGREANCECKVPRSARNDRTMIKRHDLIAPEFRGRARQPIRHLVPALSLFCPKARDREWHRLTRIL